MQELLHGNQLQVEHVDPIFDLFIHLFIYLFKNEKYLKVFKSTYPALNSGREGFNIS